MFGLVEIELTRIRRMAQQADDGFLKKTISAIALAIGFSSAAAAQTLSVTNCQVYKNGGAYRAIGVDYFTAFYRTYPNGASSTPSPIPTTKFAALEAAGIPFIRVPILAYWPDEISQFITNQSAFFAKFDPFIAAAQKYNIGVIPDFFWRFESIPDYFGEKVSAWGNASSKTRTFIASFAAAFAKRYEGNSSLWAYEFANEINGYADNPTGYQLYDVATSLGTPASYSTADNLTSTQVKDAYQAFVTAIRSQDKSTPVLSGYNMPLTDAYNLRNKFGGWDTVGQFNLELPWENSPGSIASIHSYPESWPNPFSGHNVTILQYYNYAKAAAVGALPCQPLYVGEYNSINDGSTYGTGAAGVAASLAEFKSLTNAIVSSSTSLASVWEYDNIYWTDAYNVDPSRLSYLTTVNKNLNSVATSASPN